MTASEQLLRDREQRAVRLDRSLLAMRIRALPTYGTLVKKSDVEAIVTGIWSSEEGTGDVSGQATSGDPTSEASITVAGDRA